jgi:hypothetical protein
MAVRLIPLKPNWKEIPNPLPWPAKACRWGDLTVLVDHVTDVGWHISISHRYRYPSWDEIKIARYTLCPKDITMVMYLPPEDEFVNVHERCFHLYEEKNA